MKPISVSTVTNIVKGTLVKGSEQQQVVDATPYIERIDKANMMLFMRGRGIPDWNIIKNYSPCTIVSSQLYEEVKSIEDCALILVSNVKDAYWFFVEYYRNCYDIPVITITGTSGKTTTKDMIKHILNESFKVVGTVSSANGRTNNLSYLLEIDETTKTAVFETAVGQPGDVTNACRHFKPTIGIITNIGAAHLDRCRTIENYIKAKAEMVTAVGENGILIINSDDENSKKINLEGFKGRIVYFGVNNNAHFKGSDIKYCHNGIKFTLTLQRVKYQIFVPGYGEHQVYNALAALAAVHELGIGMREAINRLQSFVNLPHHLQLCKGLNGSLILDDTWNLTPTSLNSAIKTLAALSYGRKKIALIGEVQKMGEHVNEITSEIGTTISNYKIDVVIAIGSSAEFIANTVRSQSTKTIIYTFSNTSGILDILKKLLAPKTILLTKCHMYDYPFKELLKSLIIKI